jgi:flavin-binding protein dodecin
MWGKDKGCIVAHAMFEVIGTSRDVVEEAMKEHIEKIERDERYEVVKKSVYDVRELETAERKYFSIVAEMEFKCKRLSDLVEFVLFYGPSFCEVLKPEVLSVDISEVQKILDRLGNLMLALSERVGGIVVKRK